MLFDRETPRAPEQLAEWMESCGPDNGGVRVSVTPTLFHTLAWQLRALGDRLEQLEDKLEMTQAAREQAESLAEGLRHDRDGQIERRLEAERDVAALKRAWQVAELGCERCGESQECYEAAISLREAIMSSAREGGAS